MNHQVFFAHRATFAEADDLIARFGAEAAGEAKLRASRSRDLGNVILFCHWREIERLIGTIGRESTDGPLQ
ncbi:hypothetical protein E2493_07195 [Sphingomonas parva]|uniref:Uncharacterized protein n=1 Tax=Sphingomonas parva TaxID=2555898 RepID=A0A4Y8ZU82_9SPHN|nr:hypothetical protein [Sphingomonas parva]TFI59027.1 hypothetical protein E2493_07195 [Sphingomonas parva]